MSETDFVFLADSGHLMLYGMIPVLRVLGPSTTPEFEMQVLLYKFGWVNCNEDELHLNPAKVEAGGFDDLLAEIEEMLDD